MSSGTCPSVVESWNWSDYRREYQCVVQTPTDGLNACLIDSDHWYKDRRYIYHEDHIVVAETRLDACLQWPHVN